MKEPKYKVGDKVGFYLSTEDKNKLLIGEVYIVDAHGTFEQHEEPSYDIMVENFSDAGDCLVKHVRESECVDGEKDNENYQADKPWKPKPSEEYWYMGTDGIIYHESWLNSRLDKGRYAIGNCFRTKAEAEQAVEKLKAYKRLQDAGFKFHDWYKNQTGTIDCFATWGEYVPPRISEVIEDLNLLFGGDGE